MKIEDFKKIAVDKLQLWAEEQIENAQHIVTDIVGIEFPKEFFKLSGSAYIELSVFGAKFYIDVTEGYIDIIISTKLQPRIESIADFMAICASAGVFVDADLNHLNHLLADV